MNRENIQLEAKCVISQSAWPVKRMIDKVDYQISCQFSLDTWWRSAPLTGSFNINDLESMLAQIKVAICDRTTGRLSPHRRRVPNPMSSISTWSPFELQTIRKLGMQT